MKKKVYSKKSVKVSVAKVSKKIDGNLKDFYHQIEPQVKELKRVSKEQVDAFLTKRASDYAATKKLSLKEGKRLMKEAGRSWGRIVKGLNK
jgi:hypothetical protein